MSYFPTNKHSYSNVTIANGGTAIASGLSYTTATTATWSQPNAKVKITDSDIEIDGLSLKDSLRTLHERLAILVPNPSLEKEFEELRTCANRYRELEREFTEQLKMWNTLKSTDNK